MTTDDIEARLHSALDELTRAVPLRHPDRPRTTTTEYSPVDFEPGITNGSDADEADISADRSSRRIDPKLLVLAACVLVLLAALGVAGLSRGHRHHSSTTGSTATSSPLAATTVPPTTTTAVPAPPSTTSLPISVESDSAMHASGNDGPSSSILIPSSCVLSGSTVTAIGTYQGGFAPNVYNRYGDVVVLNVFGPPSASNPQGAQLGASSVSTSPAVGSGTWQVSTTADLSTGGPARCIVAAQPTHQIQLAP